jgi:alkanesulfonate monooxygenase SsuD/methylene tetrahydromethanopterin reductase-like flavin-dependent oxidoreductase (luciferase family)
VEFGIQVEPQFGYSFADVVGIAKTGLKNNFSVLWFSDHFMLDADAIDKQLLEPWLLMTALTQVVPDIRVGSMVFSQSYRNPALSAKMAATLDVLSNGRFIFGIGAGWKQIEYNAYGYPFPDAKTRINQLAEAVQIHRGIWSNERFTFKGKHYQVNEVISHPKPVQQPMPIWIGAQKGRELMLRVTARYGDAINIAWGFSPDYCKDRFMRLEALCKKVGRDSGEIIKSVGCWTRFFESSSELEKTIKQNAKDRGIPEAEYRKRIASALWGTADDIIDKIRAYSAIGVSHLIFMFPHQQEITQLKSLAKHVLSKI